MTMAKDANVFARVDASLKEQAEGIFVSTRYADVQRNQYFSEPDRTPARPSL